ncbi:MAG TPA: VacJ family lipoprotein [Sphingomonas sp.]|uniref:MlaA family lipoprotein n=1 Tax=Sphingomonas sp. TaxID=28214 RepID=UPI002ED911B4
MATVCVAALLGGNGAAQAQTPASPPVSAPTPAQPGPTSPAPTAAAAEPGFLTDGLGDPAPEPRDRYEKLNRGIWDFNQVVDRILLKPVSSGYRKIVPRILRSGISHVFNNLGEPWSFVNNLLQGKPKRALNNLGRFVVNTTIGVGGLVDHASKIGIAPRPEDFGQTLAVWGVKSSAYVVLPVLGPSTVRDGVGTGVSFVADPYQIALNQSDLSVWTKRGIAALSVVSIRADLTESGADEFLASSLDPYASARSAFLQRRAAAIANQEDDALDDAGPGMGADTGGTDPAIADPSTSTTAPETPAAAPASEPQAPPTPTPSAIANPPAASPRLAYLLD